MGRRPVNEEERQLILRTRQGDQEAFREIFNQYRDRVYRVAYGVVRHREDALDIVQEVFIKLFRSLQHFRGESGLYTYVYRIAMNTAIDYARRTKPFPTSNVDDEGSAPLSDRQEKRPEGILMTKELEERINMAIGELPEEQRAALLLREVEGLSYQEMADTLGCSIGTVMSRLHYGRKKVQEHLKEYVHLEGK